ncbi:MAG: hypothetical protein WKG01_29370 [Kofleriaceae bacterium]
MILLLAVNWYRGKLDGLLPKFARSTSVLGDQAPAARSDHEADPKPEANPAN